MLLTARTAHQPPRCRPPKLSVTTLLAVLDVPERQLILAYYRHNASRWLPCLCSTRRPPRTYSPQPSGLPQSRGGGYRTEGHLLPTLARTLLLPAFSSPSPLTFRRGSRAPFLYTSGSKGLFPHHRRVLHWRDTRQLGDLTLPRQPTSLIGCQTQESQARGLQCRLRLAEGEAHQRGAVRPGF